MSREEQYRLLREIKLRMVAARRAGDDALAAELSQEKEKVKTHLRWCIWPGCGVPITNDGRRKTRLCVMHSNMERFYSRRLKPA